MILSSGHLTTSDREETINRLNNFLELSSQIDNELHVKEVDESGFGLEMLETNPKRIENE